MPDIRNIAIWVLAVACLVLGAAALSTAGLLKATRTTLRATQEALQTQSDNLRRQKAEAAATLRALNASVLAQQKRIDAAHAAQEKTDAQNLATVGGLRDQLRRERLRHAPDAARRGDGGGGAAGPAGAGADHRAGGRAAAAGLLPDPEAAADEDAYLADRVNEAYRSCRARLLSAPAE